jgi:DNA (cytosine-5)-methyltransferase 1
MESIELFAGAGGLALGIAQAGFSHLGVFERDSHSCNALITNINKPKWLYESWPVIQQDIAKVSFREYEDKVQLVSGGPPCQPFSIGGKHRGYEDSRDMFPHAARAVREARPQAFIFENVRGLLRKSFAKYFEYVLLRLTYPELVKRSADTWTDHLSRLEAHHTRGKYQGLHYRVVFRILNAADYGVPQKRERVFIVGFRSDVEQPWNFPPQTCSEQSLLYAQWVTGKYWDEHSIPKSKRPTVTPDIARKASEITNPALFRWRTVRDTIADLPDPCSSAATKIPGHRFQAGARAYKGHTGSPLDMPAKTLKAGDHGVPGGENMLQHPDGSVRYFTVRESARLQTFPDSYVFPSSWTESMRQIGNAVPVTLASVVARSVKVAIENHMRFTT